MIQRENTGEGKKRVFASRLLWFVVGTVGVFAFLGVYSLFVEPQMVRIEKIDFRIGGLRADLDGFKIGVLADLHMGSPISIRRADRAVALLKEHDPDVVVLAGDMISSPDMISQLDMTLSPLGRTYAVLGNWDKRYPDAIWHRSSLVTVLKNRGVLLAPGLYLAGVDDQCTGTPDLDAALEGAPLDAHRILVSHAPDFADEIREEDRISLVISGHSHGGQVRIPGFGALILPPMGRKYPMGLYRLPHVSVYTSRGVGTSHLPVRFLCAPEVTLITLRATD